MNSPAVDTPRAPGFAGGRRAEQWQHDRAERDRVGGLLHGLPTGFVVFDELELPKPSSSVIDHLVVGPRNVWAVTSLVLAEPVTFGSGRNADTLWAGRTPLRTVLEEADWEVSAVSRLIGVEVEPILCIVAPSMPEPSFDFHGIRITDPESLTRQVTRSTAAFIDVVALTETIRRSLHVEPAAGTTAPTLGVPVVPGARAVPKPPRRRRTLGARIHALRSRTIVRLAFVAALVLVLLAFLPRVVGVWDSVATEGAERINDVIDDVGSSGEGDDATDDAFDDAFDDDPRDPGVAVAPRLVPPPTPVRYELTCPEPGGGWVVTWVWPGPLPDDVAGYSVRTQVGGAPPVVHALVPWSEPTAPPPEARIAQSGTTTVFTDHRGTDGAIVATTTATLRTPTEPC